MSLGLVGTGVRALSTHLNRYFRVLKGVDPDQVDLWLLPGGRFSVQHSATHLPVVEITDDGLIATLADESVPGPALGDGAVTEDKLADGAVTSLKIADGTIVNADVAAAAAIAGSKLADGSVASLQLADGTIVNADINAAANIDAAKLADGTILVAKLADGAVTSAKILDGTIVNADINAAANIDGAKLLDASVTSAKLTGASVPAGSITTTEIANNTIVDADVNTAAAILSSKLAAGGTADRVVATTNGTTVGMAQITAGMIATGASMKQLFKTTLGSDQATIDFTSVPSGYSGLMIQVLARSSNAGAVDLMTLRLGTAGSLDATAVYDYQHLYAAGAAAGATEAYSQTQAIVSSMPGNTALAGSSLGAVLMLPNYTNTTFFKKVVTTYMYGYGTAAANQGVAMYGATWRNLGAVDTIRLFLTGQFKAGSVFILWGLP